MAIDPYSLCPCGSGKKVKFCCQDIVEEMQKILSMRQNNQLHMALQALSRLRKSLKSGHPGELWVRTTEATILLEDDQLDLARNAIAEALESLPDNPQLLALSAITSVLADGYEAAQEVVDRALQQSSTEQRHLVANLAALVAQHFMQDNKVMAARQHLSLALRMSVDPAPLVEQLSSFDGNPSLPFWFRSDYFLKTVDVADELKPDYETAAKLEAQGCYSKAAAAFEAIANKDPENSGLWYNTALCLAWSGDEPGAIEAFGEAACTEDDFDEAVFYETLCQVLEMINPEDGIDISRASFKVKSVGKLLTLWENHPRIVKNEDFPEDAATRPAGAFQLLDRPAVTAKQMSEITPADVPIVIADIMVLDSDADNDAPAVALVEYYGKEPAEEIVKLLMEAAGEELEIHEEPTVVSMIPSEIYELHHNWAAPPDTPIHAMHRLERERWKSVVDDVWPNLPLAALDGKTPLEAVGDDELKISLAAAINTLEAICDERDYFFDPQPLRERLKVPEPIPLTIGEQSVLSTLPVPKLLRLPIAELTDDQLIHVMRRTVITQVSSLSYAVFSEMLQRPDIVAEEDVAAIYSALVGLCRGKFDREEALRWIAQGRDFDRQRNAPLEKVVTWDLREATVRLWEPDDPEGPQILKRLWDETSVKLPHVKMVLQRLVETTHIDPPWDGSVIQTAESAAPATDGVWTPGEKPASEPSKLWIPGQD